MSLLPFFWPTQTLILDDDELFIVELKEIYKDKKNIIFSTSPIDSLNYLSNLQFDNQWYKHLLDYGYYEKKLYDIDYKKICNNIYSPERFKQVTTIIVDHNMPSMSGIEFCTKVAQYSNANKILLTANMDYKQAVNHLNQSIINEFYIKQDIIYNISAFLEKIHRSSHEFFHNISKDLSILIRSKAFHSKEYRNYIHQLIQDLNIAEYYLLNDLGWYLLLDNNGQSYGVFIFSQESADEIIEEAKLRFVDAEAIQSLANYQNILCFYSTSTTDWPKSHVWKKYIHRADKILISGDNYYIACVKDSIDIDYNNLYFYNQMLTNASSTI